MRIDVQAFLTLEIIPVIITYWRQEQLLWERLESLDPQRLRRMRLATYLQELGSAVLVGGLVSTIYVTWAEGALYAALAGAGVLVVAGLVVYLSLRPAARRQVWPTCPAIS